MFFSETYNKIHHHLSKNHENIFKNFNFRVLIFFLRKSQTLNIIQNILNNISWVKNN